MMVRFIRWMKQIAVSLDQFLQTLIVGIFYWWGWTDTCPSADETISSYVGRGARRRKWWALILAPAIDGLFRLLGEDWGHCERNIETAAAGEAPTP